MAVVLVTPYLDDGDVRLYYGDCIEVMAAMEADSVDCVVTSPPYWNLRDYGVAGQIGLEANPAEFVERLVAVFREVWRVLAPHGTCWINLGDSYADVGYRRSTSARRDRAECLPDQPGLTGNLKAKDLVGTPWRVALALQDDGWWLRSDVIWSKPNPMPESVRDRPTKAHEYVFLITKAERYYYDADALAEPASYPGGPGNVKPNKGAEIELMRTRIGLHKIGPRLTRNIRSVWEIATQPYPEAHFATFPEALVERCVGAGLPEQICRECGEPRRRIVDVEYENPGNRSTNGPRSTERRHLDHGTAGYAERRERRATTTGLSDCGHGDYRPGIVLDPFIGSGTTALVARRMGRHAVGIDISAEYLGLAAKRLRQLSLLGGAA